MKKRSLTFKLSLYILLSASLLLLFILIYNYQVSKNLLLKEARQTAIQLANATINDIESVLVSTEKIPSNLIYAVENQQISEKDLLFTLEMIVKNNKEIFGSCIAFEPYAFKQGVRDYAPYFYKSDNGVMYKELSQEEEYDYFLWPWYTLPKQEGRALWTEPYFDEGGGDILMTTYSVPFYNPEENERFLGVITADISLDWLEELMSSIKVYQTGYAFLITREGVFITHPNNQLRMQETVFSIAEKLDRPDIIELAKGLVEGETGFVHYESLFGGTSSRIYYAPLERIDWSIGVVFPEKELFAGLDNLFINVLIIGTLGILILFFLIIMISRNITRPISRLAGIAERIGQGNFNAFIGVTGTTLEINTLSNAFIKMQEQLKDYVTNLETTTSAKEKIESELKIAHDIQQGMIPKLFPPFPDRRDIDIFALLEPARQVGGDLFDFFFLDRKTLCFAIGDVSDKGVPASLLMAITITLLRANAKKDMSPSDIVNQINRNISKDNDSFMFVTFFIGLLDLEDGKLEYCNAGHNYPYLIKDRKLVELQETHGMPMGVNLDHHYRSDVIHINKGDKLVLFTDGVTEAISSQGAIYGDDRLTDLINNNCIDKNPEYITAIIKKDILDFSEGAQQSDDITIMVLEYFSIEGDEIARDELVLDNKIAQVDKVHDLLNHHADGWKLTPAHVYEINLVIEEILSNIIKYAYKDDKVHQIRLIFTLDENTLSVLIVDDGIPFNLLEVPEVDTDKSVEDRDVGGLGIHFIRNLTDDIKYEREDDKNKLLIIKNIKE